MKSIAQALLTFADARSPLTLCAVASLFCGCGGSYLHGKIDGDEVPPFATSVVYELQGSDAESYGAVAAFYSFDGECDLVNEWNETRARAARDVFAGTISGQQAFENVVAFEQRKLPDDYWAAYVLLSDDNAEDLGQKSYEVNRSDHVVLVCHATGPTRLDPEFAHISIMPDVFRAVVQVAGTDAVPPGADKNLECYIATDGHIEARAFEDGEYADIVASELEFDDERGSFAGEANMRGRATWCDAAGDTINDSLAFIKRGG